MAGAMTRRSMRPQTTGSSGLGWSRFRWWERRASSSERGLTATDECVTRITNLAPEPASRCDGVTRLGTKALDREGVNCRTVFQRALVQIHDVDLAHHRPIRLLGDEHGILLRNRLGDFFQAMRFLDYVAEN